MHKYIEQRGEKAPTKSVANSDISRVHEAPNRAVVQRCAVAVAVALVQLTGKICWPQMFLLTHGSKQHPTW